MEVNYRATTTGDDAPRAPQFGFDGLHEREPGEHTRGDIRAPGRLPRQVTPRGAHARRPPTARRIGTHRGGRIQFFRSRSNASADRPSRLTRSPTVHPTHARRVRSSRTSCTSSCDSPPRSAWTAFPTVRTRSTRPIKHNAAPRMNDTIASIASSDRSSTTYRRAARRRGATHPGDGATPTPGPAHTHTRRREPPSGERREKDDDRE